MKKCVALVGVCAFVGMLQAQSAGNLLAQDNAELAKRVDQLSEQIIDMKVEIGTLESLARTRPANAAQPPVSAGPTYGGNPGDAARLNQMETQIRALTAQIESLTREVRVLKQQQHGQYGSGSGYAARSPNQGSSNFGAAGGRTADGFGSTTTTTPSGGVSADPNYGAPASTGYVARNDPSAAPYGTDGYTVNQGPQQLYETAYGYMLQQDYGAAHNAFSKFLNQYPGDRLAGNAQYWLGETYYVRGQYRPAASAFLKGYKNYKKSQKAPDSLLKLAMSLNKLGQKDAACSSFAELSTRFPQAPKRIAQKARVEKRRAGC